MVREPQDVTLCMYMMKEMEDKSQDENYGREQLYH